MLKEKEIKTLIKAALDAGGIVKEKYLTLKQDGIKIKKDNSELTEADLAADELLQTVLKNNFPNIPVISEENKQAQNLQIAQTENIYFLIDPLDGTKEFINGGENFTINIALINDAESIWGVVYKPIKDELYVVGEDKKLYFQQNNEITLAQKKEHSKIVLITKRSPEQEIIKEEFKENDYVFSNIASSYKFCLLAIGEASLYPRRENINGWDIAAGDAILQAAGGAILDLNGEKVQYKFDKDFKMPFFNAISKYENK